MKSFFILLSLSSFAVNAQSFKGSVDCEREKLAEFNSIIVQKIQRASGITTSETKAPLENHYYPQMSRPTHIELSTKRSVKEVSLVHKNRKIKKLAVKKLSEGNYQFDLPKLKKFKGKIQLVFDKGARCERSLTLEGVSP